MAAGRLPAQGERRAERWRHRREWLVLVVGALLLLAWLHTTPLLRQANLVWSDTLQRAALSHTTTAPVLVVTIDEQSLRRIGPWPWRLDTLAELLDVLRRHDVRAVAVTLPLLAEGRDVPAQQRAFADEAARWSDRIVLPQWPQALGPRLPLLRLPAGVEDPTIRWGLAGLSEDDDGVWRHLAQAGEPRVPHLVEVLQAAVRTSSTLAGEARGEASGGPYRIGFTVRPGGLPMVSAADVLQQRAPASLLRGRLVLIGATAPVLGEYRRTPANEPEGRMSAVEAQAHALVSLLQGKGLTAVPTAYALGLSLLVAAPLWLKVGLRGAAAALVRLGVMLAVALLLSAVLQWTLAWVWSPWPAMGVMAVTAGLWRLRRASDAVGQLLEEIDRTARSLPALSPTPPPGPSGGAGKEPASAPAARLWLAQGQLGSLRDNFELLLEAVDHLPDPMLVCDTRGLVRMTNLAARRFVPSPADESLIGASVRGVLAGLFGSGADIQGMMQRLFPVPAMAALHEATDLGGRDVQAKTVPTFGVDGEHVGWILTLTDFSPIRQRQRDRDDALHFLSHDMRAPQAATLALLDMARNEPDRFPLDVLIERVERHTRRAYQLSDGFIQLLRARSGSLQQTDCNLSDLLSESMDDHWEQARRFGVRLTAGPMPDEAFVRGDREMIGRAMGNLIGNALKYSMRGAEVVCRIDVEGAFWVVAVQDHGPGIAPDEVHHLFRPFYRARQGSETAGAGLGLPMVKAVAERHGGRVDVRSVLRSGSTFRIHLPQGPLPTDEEAA